MNWCNQIPGSLLLDMTLHGLPLGLYADYFLGQNCVGDVWKFMEILASFYTNDRSPYRLDLDQPWDPLTVFCLAGTCD